jgi:type II restriction enzyme
MKVFRAIRRGVRNTLDSIATGTFGTDFKGSPLEVVLNAITEQEQVFEGALLEAGLNATREHQVLVEMNRLAAAQIKGPG